MERLKQKGQFKFQYLPDFANYLLNNKLEEFATVQIRFCREEQLPMLQPLSKMTEPELVNLSMHNTREQLESLSKNSIAEYMDKRIQEFINNRIKDMNGNQVISNTSLVAEDIIIGFYIRRKTFSFFLHSYTPNAVLHTLIINELDYWTTYEHLFTTQAFVKIMNDHKNVDTPVS